MHYYELGGILREACASVAIEHDTSARNLAVAYFSEYHRNGHRTNND